MQKLPIHAARVVVVVVVVVVALSAACSTPLASRRAQVLEKGEVEFLVVPALGTAAIPLDPASPSLLPLANVEGSVRFGIFDRVDVQLRVDQFITPELSAGFQVLGDPAVDEFALTVTGGAKLGLLPAESSGGLFPSVSPNLSVPVQLLADLPLANDIALFGGLRTIFGARFDDAGGTSLGVTPGATIGVSMRFFDWFVLQPEIAANYPIRVAGPALFAEKAAFFFVGMGVGGRFDIGELKGGRGAKAAAPDQK